MISCVHKKVRYDILISSQEYLHGWNGDQQNIRGKRSPADCWAQDCIDDKSKGEKTKEPELMRSG
jgi:hypothetical protein